VRRINYLTSLIPAFSLKGEGANRMNLGLN
jgi:hypothetical protein